MLQGLSRWQQSRSEVPVQGTAYDPSQVQDLQVVFTLNAGSETDMFRRLGRYMYIAANLCQLGSADSVQAKVC